MFRPPTPHKVEVFKAGEEAPYRAQVSHYSPELELAALTIVERDTKKTSGSSSPKAAGSGGAGRRGAAAAAAAAGKSSRAARAGVVASSPSGGAVEEAEEDLDDEERFWAGVQPLQLGSLPRLQQDVQAGCP